MTAGSRFRDLIDVILEDMDEDPETGEEVVGMAAADAAVAPVADGFVVTGTADPQFVARGVRVGQSVAYQSRGRTVFGTISAVSVRMPPVRWRNWWRAVVAVRSWRTAGLRRSLVRAV